MSRDEGALQEATRAWFERARVDLEAADLELLSGRQRLLEDVFFHAQQAVEKALKGFLTWNDQPFRKTHNLDELGASCALFDATLQPLVDRAVPLTEYAWAFRYPGAPHPSTRAEAVEAMAIARELYQGILARLPAATHPTDTPEGEPGV
jgi:HEPN domain-containing protein